MRIGSSGHSAFLLENSGLAVATSLAVHQSNLLGLDPWTGLSHRHRRIIACHVDRRGAEGHGPIFSGHSAVWPFCGPGEANGGRLSLVFDLTPRPASLPAPFVQIFPLASTEKQRQRRLPTVRAPVHSCSNLLGPLAAGIGLGTELRLLAGSSVHCRGHRIVTPLGQLRADGCHHNKDSISGHLCQGRQAVNIPTPNTAFRAWHFTSSAKLMHACNFRTDIRPTIWSSHAGQSHASTSQSLLPSDDCSSLHHHTAL